MLIEVNQCNVLKDNKISYNVKTYRVTPQKVQYIVNLLYTHPIVLPDFFSIIYILLIIIYILLRSKGGIVGVYIFGSLCTEPFACISISMHNAEY